MAYISVRVLFGNYLRSLEKNCGLVGVSLPQSNHVIHFREGQRRIDIMVFYLCRRVHGQRNTLIVSGLIEGRFG